MATPEKHARCSASSAHRWLNCTAAPTFESQFLDSGETSVYALEGTLAHSFCETAGSYNFGIISKVEYTKKTDLLRKNELYKEEMEKTTDFYQHYLWEKSVGFKEKPYVTFEARVDFSEFVPGGFGTCDCIMIGGDTLHITDYKHGQGVRVSAENNPQMRLYALGALRKYQMFYSIKNVSMAIVQPRISETVDEDTLSVEDLLKWGEQIKPLAQKAYTGEGAEFHEGSWCKFCKGKQLCKARADNFTALQDFVNVPIEGKLTTEEKKEAQTVLTDADVSRLLKQGANIVEWYNDLRGYAMDAILSGGSIDGYKILEGRSVRKFTDVGKVFSRLRENGYDDSKLYDKTPKSLSQIEKMVGKKKFSSLVGEFVEVPPGKPKLAGADEKGKEWNPAVSDFKGVADGA